MFDVEVGWRGMEILWKRAASKSQRQAQQRWALLEPQYRNIRLVNIDKIQQHERQRLGISRFPTETGIRPRLHNRILCDPTFSLIPGMMSKSGKMLGQGPPCRFAGLMVYGGVALCH